MSLRHLIERCLGERDALSVAREHASRWQPWLQPISADLPVGEDPGYDDDFQCMREEVNKLSGASTERVIALAEKLLTHTCKDLRVATYYLWARLHRDGGGGIATSTHPFASLV
ncbi:ImpA family type VI secretion system protein, partial [Pseudomonas sp. SMN5]|uniref:type VI secretion system protein TssA n=1 Tax=Pseudomonas sp. SMN5 TaxID=3390198 RepID=UPI003F82AAB0